MRKNCCNYPVEFSDGLFGEDGRLADTLRKLTGAEKPRVMLVADYNLVQRTEGLGTAIGKYFQANGLQFVGKPFVNSGGEKVKNDRGMLAGKLAEEMLRSGFAADDLLLVIGGGSLFDLVGYVAGQYRGGVRAVRVPTTPAAMIDAAFSERALMDFGDRKDLLGVPSEPAAVMIQPSFAASVLDGVWRAGFAEAVRLVADFQPKALAKLEALAPAWKERSPEALRETVELTVPIRTAKGRSELGEEISARLEEQSEWKMPHGYAVAIGLAMVRPETHAALRASGALEGLEHSEHRVRRFLESVTEDKRTLYSDALNLIK